MPFSDEQQDQLAGIQDQEKQFSPDQGPGPGDPKTAKTPAKVVALPGTQPNKPGLSGQGLSPEAIERITKNVQEGTSGIKQDVPDNIDFQPKAGQDNYLLRAQDQGFVAQLAKTVGNIIPNVAADMLDMAGQLSNIGGTAQGASDYDSGGFGRLATAIRDPFGEVYREHPDKTFDMGDSAWWLSNISGFAQGAASFVLPGEGEAALFSKLGKAVTEGLSLGKNGIVATQAIGHAISAFSMGYLMSAGSGKKVYDESYKANYDRFIRQGYDPSAADDQAHQMAAEGAAKTVQIGTLLNGILNLTALSPLFRETPQAAISRTFKTGEGAINEGESLADWSTRLKAMNPEENTAGYRAGLTSHGFQAFQVGLQGLNTEYAEKRGREVGTGTLPKRLDMISDYFDKVTDSEGALNMLSGLLGGLTQNILMDRVPLHSIVKIDPSTNKPLYKADPNLIQEGGKTQYQTELVSARTRDMMNNRQYFSSIRDAVLQDATHMKSIQDLMDQAQAKGDLFNADRYRRQLTAIGDLNAVTMGMTDSWQKTYQMMAEQHPENKAAFTEATEQLKGLQAIHDRIADKFAPYAADPDMGRLQDHIFHQEANHYLLGKAIDKEATLISRDESILGPLHQYNNEVAIYGKVRDKIKADVSALDKAVEKGDHVAMAKVMQKYGVNAYGHGDLRTAATQLTDRLSARAAANNQRAQDAISALHTDTGFTDWEKTNPGKSLTDYLGAVNRDYPVDDRLAERKAALEKARVEHEEMARNLAEINSKSGSDRFIKAVQKNAADWQEHLDRKAQLDTENLFLKQQDKETAAKLDKNQQGSLYNQAREQRVANDDKKGLLGEALVKHQADLSQLETKKGFFKHFTDLSTKKDLRSKIASIKAEIAHLDLQNAGHDRIMSVLSGNIQQAAIKEDAARNAHREDVENDLHQQQDVVAPTVTEPAPPEGIPEDKTPMPESVSRPAEDDYASLRTTLAPRLQSVLDNLELIMPDADEFHRDLVHNAFYPFVANQEISEDRVHDITEKMKDWWTEKKSNMDEMTDTAPLPSTAPVPDDAILAQDNQVSPIPEPDSPLISYNAALNDENMSIAQVFREVGAKALTSMKVNSRSIEYMRVEKAGSQGTVETEKGRGQIKHTSFLPMYDKLDPTFNRNTLKPGFVSIGDPVHFQVDQDWNGQVTLDKADAPDEYGMPTGRQDSFADYSTPDGKIIMTKQAPDLEAPFANAPIKIIHTKSGETIGYLPRVDWVTAKRPDTMNYRNIEDNVRNEDGTISGGNVEAQRAKLMALRATIAQAHNNGEAEPVRTHIDGTGPGHVFLSTDVNVNSETSKLTPKLAKNLLPDPKLTMAILDKGTMMVGHGVPHAGPANFTAKTLREKYQTAGQQWNNTPMVLLPMPNGKVTESPLFTRKLEKRPGDIHTVAKAVESYLAHGTAAETDEHRGIIDKLNQHTGYDISTEKGLRSFINQYYTYSQKFSEVHTRANAEVDGEKVPRFMLDIPDMQPGEQKAAIKVGTSFSGVPSVYALTRDGKINPDFDQALRDGLPTHYKNVVYTTPDIKGINDLRPITAVTIQRDGKVRTDKYANYNEYLKSFASTAVYGLHRAADGTYLYGANPITEFDFNEAVQPRPSGAEIRETPGDEGHEELIRQMMNSALTSDELPVPHEPPVPRTLTRDDLVLGNKGKPLDEPAILANINKLYDEAAANPEHGYHIDIPGAGRSRFRTADGSYMTHFKLAQVLGSREIPYNIRLGDDIRSALENTPRRFLNSMMFEDDSMYSPLPIDDKVLGEQLDNTFVPVRDEQGTHTGGYFSPERQEAVVDSVVKAISIQLDKRPLDEQGKPIKVGDYMKLVKNNVFANLSKIYQRIEAGETIRGFDVTPEQAANLTREFRLVLNSFEPHPTSLSFWSEAMKKLDGLGIRVKETGRQPSLDRVPDSSNGNDEVMKEAEGTGIGDWSDSHFEQNPMDSASSRIKMFMATTTDSTVGNEPLPPQVKLSFTDAGVRQDIVKGTKLFTTRTPDQAKTLGLDKPGAEALTKVDGKDFRVTTLGPLQADDVHATQIGMEEGTTPVPGDMKLQLTPWKPKPEQLIPNRNYLGLPKLADYEQLYEDTMSTLGDTPRDLQSYIARLKDEGRNGKPNLYALATNLEKTGTQMQSEFVSVMTLHYQPFTMMLADSRTDPQGKPYYQLRAINANRASQLNTLIDHWQQSQKFSPILHKDATGTTTVNKAVAQQLKTELHDINRSFNSSDKDAPNKAKELLRKTLESNGVVLPEKGIDSLIANTARWTKKTSLAGDFRKQFAVTEDGKAQGLVSAFILRLAGEGGPEEALDSAADKSYQLNNPLYMEGTAMKVLARVAAAYTPNLYSNTHRSGEGKSIYDWGLPHKLSNDFAKLKDNEQWRAQFQDSDFAKRSWLLDRIANDPEARDRAGLSYLDSIRAAYGKQDSGTIRPKMSDREQLITAVGLFQNGNDNRYAHYLSLTHSDRSTSPVFMNMPRLSPVTQMKLEYDKLSGARVPKFAVHDEVIKRLYDVFLSEYDRINKASQVIAKEGGYNDERYEKGSQFFYMLPQFNHDRMAEMVKEGKITEGDFNSVWMMGDKKLNVLEGRGFKDAVDKVLRQHVELLMGNTVKEWRAKGIVDDENIPFDRRYINKLLSYVGIHGNQDGTYRTRDNQEVPAAYVTKLSTQLAARDYAVNSYLFNTSLSQVFFGDPAQNFKGSVEKTMVEYGKRLTQFISPRKEGNWDSPHYQSVTVKDFTTNVNYLGELSKAYEDINATDAQELTTVQEKLDVLKAYGRIPQETYIEMSKIIKDAKGGYYEFTKPEHQDIVMQPEKPLYSGSRPPSGGAILNDYVKSSAYALYPPLLAGKELDQVRTAMEKGGIARLNFESAKKVGIPAKGIQLFDSNGRIRPGVFESPAWTGTDSKGQPVQSARQELSRDNFGLSQEVPYDELKESIRTVSQMNKLIMEAIPTIKAPFDYQGRPMSGSELQTEKENIRKSLIDINHQKLLEETGATINDDGNLVIRDKQKIYDALLKHASDQGGYSPNDLAILQHTLPNTDELIVPLMYSPNASKFENLVMSMVNGITDIYIPGKSYVQASSAGHQMVRALGDISAEERRNIVHVGDWDGGPLKMLRKDDTGKVLPGQILLPFNFQKGGRRVSIEDYVTTDESGRRTIDPRKIPPELLQIVAARIPNSGHNLMHPMEIVGFLPDQMGDLAIVPDAITRQMGSDFDVDKLFTYRRAYIPKEEGGFEPAREGEDKLKNDYFDTHWSVLMNPDMTSKILSPLDKEDLKDEASQIEKWENRDKTRMSFYDPIYQLRDFQSQKDAKRLVGASSLSVTFNSVIQDKGLTIGFVAYHPERGPVPEVVPIELIDEDGKKRSLTYLSGYGQSEYRRDGEKTGEMRTKNDNHVMQQAEFLDYSKNRISDKVHLTVQSYPASAALTQLQEEDGDGKPGWAPSIKYNARLLSQAIIQEYSQEMAKAQDTFSEGFDPDRKNTIIDQLTKKYLELGKVEDIPAEHTVSYEDLTDGLKKGPSQKDFYLKQAAALQLFKQLEQVGTQMMTAQSTINQDVNGAGPNLLMTMGKDYTRSRLELPLFSAPDKLAILHAENLYTRPDGKATEQGHLYDTIHQAAYGIAGEFFPYRDMRPLFDFVMEHTNRDDLSVDMQKSIFNAMKSYLFSHPKLGLWDDPVATRTKLLYGEDSLAKRVLTAKNTWGKNDLFLQRLQPDIDPDGLRPDYLKYQAAKITKLDMDENTRHWVDLLTSEDPAKQQLGHDLVRYAYLTGGIQDSQNFIKFLPYSFLLGTDFGHKLRELTGGIKDMVMAPAFRTQVFQHNPQIAKTVSADFRETGGALEKYPERFSFPQITPGESNPAGNMIVKALDTDGKRREMYPEFVSHYSKDDGQWVLYRKASMFNGSEFGCNYVRIDTLGSVGTDEYSFRADGLSTRSLIPQNRSRAYDNIEPAFRMLNSALTNGHGAEVLRDLEIPQYGGHKELSEVLTRIATDDSVPDHARVLSSWLSTIHEQNGSAADALSQLYGEKKHFLPALQFRVIKDQDELTKLSGSPWSAAMMDSMTNKLYLGEANITDKARLAELLNHELLHYHTASITQLNEDQEYMMNRYKGNLDTIRFAQTLYRNITDRNPEIKEAIDDLHQVRRQVLDAIKGDMLKRGMSFQQEYDKVFKEDRIENNWHRYIYAAGSNTEFVSHALSDINFMRYLNTKDASGETKGILPRIGGIVKRLMSAIATALGVDPRKGSLLEHAIDKSMALMLKGRAGTIPDRAEMASENNMEPTLNMRNAALASPTLTAMDKLAGKLQEQHDEISNALTGRLSREEYSEKRTKLDQIEKDVEALRQNQSFQVAAQIGNRHLEWVQDVLKQEKPTPSQIMTANRVLEVWGNLIPLVYGGGESAEAPDPAFAEISAKAQDAEFKLLRKSEQALIDLSDGTLTMRDYSPERLKDIGKDQALMRDVVSAAGSKVTQYVGTLLQTTARHVADDVTRLVKETRAMETAVAAQIGGKGHLKDWYNQFFQENKKGDAWGLVQKFSQNWYDFRRGERAKRNASIKRIEEGGGDPAQKAQMKGQAWEHYWKTVDSHAVFADTRKLFDKETGDRKDDQGAKDHIAELEKHTDPETARELVDEAHARYQQYLDHKQPYFDELDAAAEAGTRSPEETKKMKDEFENKWSPNVFFGNRNSKFGTYGGSDYYAKMAPRRAAGEFYDPKFDAMRKDPVAHKYYQWLTAKMEELKSALPVRVHDEYLGANFFPVVKRSLISNMLDIPEYIRTMGERTMRELGATPFEEMSNGSTFRQIPIDYVDRSEKANPIESRSRDIPRVIEAFGMMAMHYKHFSEARDSIDMGEAILQKLDEARAAGATQQDMNGKLVSVRDGLKNTLDAVAYMKDYLIYRKARKLEGRSDMKLYSLNPVEQIKSSNAVKELLAQREKITDQIMNGEIDPEEGSKLLEPINKELSQYGGLRIYASKLGDKLISINQLKTMSYNPFSGIANMTFGVMSAGIHANGGRDFSWKELGSALKIMMHSTAKWLSLGGKESHTADKILAIMDRTGVIGDVVDSNYGKIHVRDNKPAWRHAINPFNWMKSGDYFMKGLTTVAMMLHDKVDVVENGEAKKVSLWEAMDGEGKWNTARFGENKSWHSEDVKEQAEWDKFRNRAVRVNMIIHGNQDKTSPKLANKFILGRLIGQFRMSWLPEGWYSRFQKEHFDIQLGREVKGRYQTIAQLGFGGYAMVTLRQLYSMVGKVDPYTNATRLDGKALTETDRENMRRNFAELAFVSTIMASVVMTRAAASDSDDESTAARYRLLMNMLIRNKQDLEFYASPQVFDTMTRNIIPASTVLTDYAKALVGTGRLLFDDSYQYQQWLLAMTHAGIPIPQATLINKTKYMLQKDLDNSPY